MIKIVHLISGLGLGGAENQLFHFVTQSDQTRFKHIVISMRNDGALGSRLLTHGITLYSLGMNRIPSIKSCLALIKILRFERPRILQTWLYHADLFGLLVGKMLRIPTLVWNVRCSYINTEYYSWLTLLVIKACTIFSSIPQAIIANSNAGKVFHQKLGYREKNWFVIPNGFRTDLFKPDKLARQAVRAWLKIDETTPVIGMVARFDPMKDHDTFLLAIKLLQKKMQNFRVLLIGNGMDKNNLQIMSRINELKLEKQLFLLGSRQNIPELMNALDILVLTSIGEGFPNVLGEAMACEVPCIATDVGDSAEIIGETGKIVPVKSPESVAEAIEVLLILDEQQRQILGKKARQRIIERYGMLTMVKQYEHIYESFTL